MEPPQFDIPTPHRIAAACRLMAFLPYQAAPLAQIRESYLMIASDGVFTYSDFITAETVLLASGLFAVDGDLASATPALSELPGDHSEASQALVLRLLERSNPLWLSIATAGGTMDPSLIPSQVQRTLDGVFPDPLLREQVLLALGVKFNAARLAGVGGIGELQVVEECRGILRVAGLLAAADEVRRVSEVSDLLGYDIVSPTVGGRHRRLEVKTVGKSATGASRVFISRNEAIVGERDPSWRLVVCRLVGHDSAEVVGWCDFGTIKACLPSDSDTGCGTWATAEVWIPETALRPGLPIVGKEA